MVPTLLVNDIPSDSDFYIHVVCTIYKQGVSSSSINHTPKLETGKIDTFVVQYSLFFKTFVIQSFFIQETNKIYYA